MLRCLVAFALSATMSVAALSAQCVSFGNGCAGGQTMTCLNTMPPRIGTNWPLAFQTSCANPSSNFMMIGGCVTPGVPITPPIACPECPACEWQVLPTQLILPWTWPPRTLTLAIPPDPSLVGASLCFQNACSDNVRPCVCLSNPMQVTFLP